MTHIVYTAISQHHGDTLHSLHHPVCSCVQTGTLHSWGNAEDEEGNQHPVWWRLSSIPSAVHVAAASQHQQGETFNPNCFNTDYLDIWVGWLPPEQGGMVAVYCNYRRVTQHRDVQQGVKRMSEMSKLALFRCCILQTEISKKFLLTLLWPSLVTKKPGRRYSTTSIIRFVSCVRKFIY